MRLISHLSICASRLLFYLSEASYRLTCILDAINVAILKPEEMAHIGCKVYDKLADGFGSEEIIERGLETWEKETILSHCKKNSSLLVLGGGGGREVVALAKMGYRVTGLDSSQKMIDAALTNSKARGLEIDMIKGDFFLPEANGKKFDSCLLSCLMYSSIPSSQMRIKMLRRIKDMLTDDGILIIHFLLNKKRADDRWAKAKLRVARIFAGNTGFKPGDTFSSSLHFMRYFGNGEEVVAEADAGGFKVLAKGTLPESEHMVLAPQAAHF